MTKKIYVVLTLCLLFIGLPISATAQKATVIKGIVRDSITHEPISYASVFFVGSDKGLMTDDDGKFAVSVRDNFLNVRFSTLGYRDKAEKLFTEVSQSDFLHVSEMAKTNILYMIRRKEARTTRSFWEVLDEKKILSAFDYMNIILQCLSTDDRQNPHFSRAMKQIECLEPEEISGLVDWWNNTLLVGTEESKLALSIIYSEFHNG